MCRFPVLLRTAIGSGKILTAIYTYNILFSTFVTVIEVVGFFIIRFNLVCFYFILIVHNIKKNFDFIWYIYVVTNGFH